MNTSTMNTGVKWVRSAVAVFGLAIGIYLFGVLNVYIIAWIVEIIGSDLRLPAGLRGGSHRVAVEERGPRAANAPWAPHAPGPARR